MYILCMNPYIYIHMFIYVYICLYTSTSNSRYDMSSWSKTGHPLRKSTGSRAQEHHEWLFLAWTSPFSGEVRLKPLQLLAITPRPPSYETIRLLEVLRSLSHRGRFQLSAWVTWKKIETTSQICSIPWVAQVVPRPRTLWKPDFQWNRMLCLLFLKYLDTHFDDACSQTQSRNMVGFPSNTLTCTGLGSCFKFITGQIFGPPRWFQIYWGIKITH